VHDTSDTRDNYTKYLQFLIAKGYDRSISDLQTGYYKAFLEDPNYTAKIPIYRAALMGQMLQYFNASPRSFEDEKKIAFLFGLIAHQEADLAWHWTPDPTWIPLEAAASNLYGKSEYDLEIIIKQYNSGNSAEFTYASYIKQNILAASDAIGSRRPYCHSTCVAYPDDPILTGAFNLAVYWDNLPAIGGDPTLDPWIKAYVPGGIDYGSALVAGAWMQTWDRLSNTAIYHVKPAASGNQNCSSWDNACTLQSALSQAVNGEIWAAKGIYRPTDDDTNRSAYFHLMPTVSVYGGFAGTETARDQRDPAANLTILSGDIDLNDSQTPVITDLSTVAGNTTNSYHVVIGANNATLDGFTVTAGYADDPNAMNGGGMVNGVTSPTVTNVIFSGNFASAAGGGMYNDHSHPTLTDVTFQNNKANYGGGIENFVSNPVVANTTFVNNTAANGNGGGMHNASQTICNPYGAGSDCRIDTASPALTNVTFSGNTAKLGGGMDNDISSPTLTNITFNGNTASIANGGGSMHNRSQYTCMHWFAGICTGSDWYVSAPIVRNSLLWGNSSGEIYNEGPGNPPGRTQIGNSVVQGGCPSEATCTNLFSLDPKPGTLGNYGGFTPTIPIQAGSPAIDTGDDSVCPAADQRGVSRPQGIHCDIGAYEYDTSQLEVMTGGNSAGTYSLHTSQSTRDSYPGIDKGPVKVLSQDGVTPILASERFIYTYQNSKSYAEMTGYPDSQLATEYWFPWYNNKTYSTQLRVSNMGTGSAQVKVYAGGTEIDSFTLDAGQAQRSAYTVDQGPLHVVSTDGVTKILASERFIQTYQASASYSEMMGYPGNQLATEYWFPWYNNKTYSTQLRISNLASSGSAEIKVYAGSSTTPIDTFMLDAGQAKRISYNIDDGPLHVVSTDGTTPILASERFILTFGSSASYAEMMGYPGDQLDTEYCFPWYNNTSDGTAGLSSQLRVSNMGSGSASVKLTLAGSEIDSFTLDAGLGARKSYTGKNNGPLCVVSTDGVTNILASERFISTYQSSGSYSEMMGYPNSRLDDTYWYPWYNNKSYSTELRIAKP
jgi:hypothetical protein